MSTRMQQRRGTQAQWISTNSGDGPILAPGEIGFESDTNKFKIGDGVNHWVNLIYFTDADSIIAAVSGIVDGAPDLLNTLNELAAALGDDPSFLASLATEEYVDTAVSGATFDASLAAGTGLDWNGSQFDVDTTLIQARVTDVSDTEIGYLNGVTSDIQTQIDAKLESADLTGYATEGYVDTAITNLVDTAPAALDTLNELAAALGDDANFATTVTDSIAAKAPLASPIFTGTVDFTGATVSGISSYEAPTLGSTSIASGATVTTIAGLTLTAPTLTGTVTASGDINLSAAGGPGSVTDELTLLLMGAI